MNRNFKYTLVIVLVIMLNVAQELIKIIINYVAELRIKRIHLIV